MEGNKIRQIRRAMDLTLGEVSRALDIDTGLLSKIERNRCRETPAIARTKTKVCEFLGVESARVFPEDETKG